MQDGVANERIKAWVTRALALDETATVVITGPSDRPRGGADGGGTVIIVLRQGQPQWRHTVAKPVERVAWCDVIHLANVWDRTVVSVSPDTIKGVPVR